MIGVPVEGVAIVGIGIHPFGRHPGLTGRYQGAYAIRKAVADAGIGWPDVQCAFGGSAGAGNPDTLVSDLGLTGLPFVNVYNGCATGGGALTMAERAVRSGDHDLALAVGFDKHPRGAFNASSALSGLGDWYGETGLMLTTQFFAMKVQRYLHDHGLSADILAKVAAEAFEKAGIGPEDVGLAQLQDTESGAEIMHMAETGFCKDGEQEHLIRSGMTEISGRLPVNTDGGCLANGEPVGASGLRQVYECVLQLRGQAGSRQVPGEPRVAFTHVYGAPGISACTVLSR